MMVQLPPAIAAAPFAHRAKIENTSFRSWPKALVEGDEERLHAEHATREDV